MSRVISYDPDLQFKICNLIPTLLDFQILVRKFLTFVNIVSPEIVIVFLPNLGIFPNFLHFFIAVSNKAAIFLSG